ncbi:hypothetical protein V8F33_004889 [Rhypophila sp. PSN 637]
MTESQPRIHKVLLRTTKVHSTGDSPIREGVWMSDHQQHHCYHPSFQPRTEDIHLHRRNLQEPTSISLPRNSLISNRRTIQSPQDNTIHLTMMHHTRQVDTDSETNPRPAALDLESTINSYLLRCKLYLAHGRNPMPAEVLNSAHLTSGETPVSIRSEAEVKEENKETALYWANKALVPSTSQNDPIGVAKSHLWRALLP